MPEPLGLLWSTPEPKKKAPIIKMSCGIGDTDGFPAFDVESDDYDCKDDTKWGFLITGGAEFHMPLTVFQVSECSSSSSNSSCPYSLLTFASLPPAHVLFLPHG